MSCSDCVKLLGLTVGTKLYGYCEGFFGRDSYEEKTIEAIGTDWIVVRGGDIAHDDSPNWCYFPDGVHNNLERIKKWMEKPEEDI